MDIEDVVVGMEIVFNQQSNNEYSITVEGVTAIVISVDVFTAHVECHENGGEYEVESEYFEPIGEWTRPPKVVKAMNVAYVKKSGAKQTAWRKKEAKNMPLFDSEANFLVWTKGVKWAKRYYSKPCHGFLIKKDNKKATMVYSKTNKRNLHPLTRKFYKWLKKDSPYASVFMNKTVKSMMDDGIWVNTNAPSNLMVGGLIASRYPWARDYMLDLMFLLIKKGVSYHSAFICSHLFHKESGGGWGLYGNAPEEFSINSQFVDEELVLNFHAGIMKNPNPPYKESVEYKGVFGLWSGLWSERSFNQPRSLRDNLILDGDVLKSTGTRPSVDWSGNHIVVEVHSTKDLVDFGLYLDGLV